MKFYYRQQSRGCMNLCVNEQYKNSYFTEVKNKIISQIPFLVKNGVAKIDLQQSNISESCYVTIHISGYKYPSILKISGHLNGDETDYLINSVCDIKNEFHFNKYLIACIINDIKHTESELRKAKQF